MQYTEDQLKAEILRRLNKYKSQRASTSTLSDRLSVSAALLDQALTDMRDEGLIACTNGYWHVRKSPPVFGSLS